MALDEEYENQQSWRTSSDKLTFIVCAPTQEAPNKAGTADADALMRGDINFFLYPFENDDEDEPTDAGWVTGEVDVMIASPSHRGQGLGRAAVCALLVYIRKHIDGILFLEEKTTRSSSDFVHHGSPTAALDDKGLSFGLLFRSNKCQTVRSTIIIKLLIT